MACAGREAVVFTNNDDGWRYVRATLHRRR
jgi:hypothetical protein